MLSGINALRQTADILDPTLAFITPAQTVCHYPSILLKNAGGRSARATAIGTWLRSITIIGKVGVNRPLQPNAEFGPASAPANGPTSPQPPPLQPLSQHRRPRPDRECEAGNEPYIKGRTVIGNVPGNQGTITDEGG